ncbi:MAG: thioredoxin family protein [Flavobacteriaceae bacterium]|nr:thioredoxin family protein [Flavobacteriaceae bacterium]
MNKVIFLLFLTTSIFSNAQQWHTDFDKALEESKKRKTNIIMVFQGSDWCAPCMKLEKEIWNSELFKNHSKDNWTLLKLDFPRKRKNKLTKDVQAKNNALAEKYNQKGFFPLVVVLDYNQKVLGTTGYSKVSPSEYIEILKSF